MIGISDGAGRGILFVSVLVATMTLWAGTGTATAQSAPDCSTVSYNGAGTETKPYEVSNVEKLQCIEEHDLKANYQVVSAVSEIDASETTLWNSGKGFDPIGGFDETRDTEFNGTFDGNGHNITGLTIDRESEEFVGLFGSVGSEGRVTNVSIVDADVTGSRFVGGLAGLNRGTINNSHVTGSVTGSRKGDGLVARKVGGLVGVNVGKISESYASVSVDGTDSLGGLVGVNRAAPNPPRPPFGMISESYASGHVEGSDGVGGLVGTNEEGGTVTESYAIVAVGGSERVGGLVGWNIGGTNIEPGKVSGSYASGHVEGSEDVGGIVGIGGGTVSRSYWDVNATGWSTSNGGKGLTTAEMIGAAARNNMTALDFTNTWETVTNPDGYPVLAWQPDGSRGTVSDGSINDIGRAVRDGENKKNGGVDGNESTTNDGAGGGVRNRSRRGDDRNSSGGSDGGNEGGNNLPTDDGTEGKTEGLPGFTVLTALLAVLTVVAAASRLRKE